MFACIFLKNEFFRRDVEPGVGCYVCSCHFPNGKKENLPLFVVDDERKLYPKFPDDDHNYHASASETDE